MLTMVCGSLLAPAIAEAACTPAQRADTRATKLVVAALQSQGNPGAPDAASFLTRARATCRALPIARAIANAYARRGVPAAGARLRTSAYDLVGVATSTGVVWRVDVAMQARRVVAARSSAAATRARTRLLAAASVRRGLVVWSGDPTRATWDPILQGAVAGTLRSGRTADRLVASASVRAAGPAVRQRGISKLPVADALLVAQRFDRAAGSDVRARKAATSAALRAYARVRGASNRGWSTSQNGAWSTLDEHKLLVGRARALLVRVPHASTKRVVDQLSRSLVEPPLVQFATLPGAEFYPWPRDGAFDNGSMQLVINKPSTIDFTVFAGDDTPIRRVSFPATPGTVDIAWDGASDDGTIQPAGSYRYSVNATDLAGNQQLVAGLQMFVIARDTTAPVAKSGSVRHVTAKDGNRLIVNWKVEETHSPKVTTYLVVTKGSRKQTILVHESSQSATVRRPSTLVAGTWNASFLFIDGSGNRTNLTADPFVVR